ncbi:MAG TPA: hypothetical protein PKD92_06005 [Novosphingobium sp.]|nr:hypothetical protein [Novosphingobium sp.]
MDRPSSAALGMQGKVIADQAAQRRAQGRARAQRAGQQADAHRHLVLAQRFAQHADRQRDDGGRKPLQRAAHQHPGEIIGHGADHRTHQSGEQQDLDDDLATLDVTQAAHHRSGCRGDQHMGRHQGAGHQRIAESSDQLGQGRIDHGGFETDAHLGDEQREDDGGGPAVHGDPVPFPAPCRRRPCPDLSAKPAAMQALLAPSHRRCACEAGRNGARPLR